jgi:hypothetical protein
MTEWVTTNIRLPKELHRALKQRALEEEKSLADVLREAAAQYLVDVKEQESVLPPGMTWEEFDNDPLWLIGTTGTVADVSDAAANHDLYLYGPLSDSARAEIKDG